jgi:hypothetical protein
LEKYIIDDRIFSVKFSCDVGKCKGACCTLKGAGGAPILDEEVKIIKKNIDIVKKYLHPVHIYSLDTEGFLEGRPGNYSITSVNDEECVFSFYEEGIAKCSFQKAFYNEETEFKKPISCHLFPVRISGIKRNIIKYEEINECCDALEKGEEDNISVFEFAKDSIVREYGIGFYNDLKDKYLNKPQ